MIRYFKTDCTCSPFYRQRTDLTIVEHDEDYNRSFVYSHIADTNKWHRCKARGYGYVIERLAEIDKQEYLNLLALHLTPEQEKKRLAAESRKEVKTGKIWKYHEHELYSSESKVNYRIKLPGIVPDYSDDIRSFFIELVGETEHQYKTNFYFLSGRTWESKKRNFKKAGIEIALGKKWIVDAGADELAKVLLLSKEAK